MDTAPLEVCGVRVRVKVRVRVRVLCGASVNELGRKDVVPLSEKKYFLISWYHHHVENPHFPPTCCLFRLSYLCTVKFFWIESARSLSNGLR
jgi:hypothetical protein